MAKKIERDFMTVLMNPVSELDIRPLVENIVNSAKRIGKQAPLTAKKDAVFKAFGFMPDGSSNGEIIDSTVKKYLERGISTEKKTISYKIPDKIDGRDNVLRPIEIRAIGTMRAVDIEGINELDIITKPNPLENPPGHSSLLEFVKTSGFAVGGFSLSSTTAMLAENGVREYAKDWYNKTTDAEKKTQWIGVLASATSTAAATYLCAKYVDDAFKADAVLVGGIVATGIRALTLLAPNTLKNLNLSKAQEPTKPLSGLNKEQFQRNSRPPSTRLEQALLRNRPTILRKTSVGGLTDTTPIRSLPSSLPFVI